MFLYVLWKTLSKTCKVAGLGNEPRKIIREIRRIRLSVVVVMSPGTGKEIILRCITQADIDLPIILECLKIRMPQRWANDLDLNVV